MSVEPLRITRTNSVCPVEIENEDGTITKYVIRKLNGAMQEAYLNKTRPKLQIEGDKAIHKDFTGRFTDLLSMCLYKDESPVPMHAKDINQIDADLLQQLWLKAMEMSGLTEKAEAAEKKG